MPSTMIHLLTAREINPEESGLFWVGNFAPDFTDERERKDAVHFRTVPDRLAALTQLKSTLDPGNSFEAGWLLHLFTDLCWDQEMIPRFIQHFEKQNPGQPWFFAYRAEIGFATYFLYHHMDWAQEIWSQIKDTDISSVSSTLPVTPEELGLYRERVYRKHSESDPASVPALYDEALMRRFARETAEKYREWNK